MTDHEQIAALESRIRALEEDVRHLRTAREDDRGRLADLALVVREVQTDLARLRGLPDDVARLRERLASVELVLSVLPPRFDDLDARLVKVERRVIGAGLLGLVVVEVLIQIVNRFGH